MHCIILIKSVLGVISVAFFKARNSPIKYKNTKGLKLSKF